MSFRGVLAKRTSDLAAQNITGAAVITFEADVFDTDVAWTAGAPTVLTVPLAWNGKRGIVSAFVHLEAIASNGILLKIERAAAGFNSTPFMANSGVGTGQSATAAWAQSHTFPVVLATGDAYRILTQTVSDTSVTIKAGTSLSLYVLDEFSPAYCLAKKAADQTTANYSTPAVVAWDGTNIYDTHALHSPSSNNSKIIIPAALNGNWVVSKAVIHASNVTDASTSSLAIRKNGSIDHTVFTGFAGQSANSTSFASHGIHVQSHPFQVSTGDEIEALFGCGDTSITVTAARSSFGLTVVGR